MRINEHRLVNEPRFRLLLEISRATERVAFADLVGKLSINKHALGYHTRELTSAGLVTAELASRDGFRVNFFRPTRKGKAALAALRAEIDSAIEPEVEIAT